MRCIIRTSGNYFVVVYMIMAGWLQPAYGVTEMPDKSEKNIILIGASVGNGWKFPELTKRKNLKNLELEFIPVFDSFDKTPAIDTVLSRNKKPDTVIIKECSVYFPGELEDYEKKIINWVAQLKSNNITPVLATSVPPGEPEGFNSKFKQSIKGMLGKPKKIDSIIEYNNWIRDYAAKHGIRVLDLEKALRISDENHYLKPEYDRGDKVHLNASAYQKLDDIAEEFFKNQ